jgi:hypothetical protein
VVLLGGYASVPPRVVAFSRGLKTRLSAAAVGTRGVRITELGVHQGRSRISGRRSKFRNGADRVFRRSASTRVASRGGGVGASHDLIVLVLGDNEQTARKGVQRPSRRPFLLRLPGEQNRWRCKSRPPASQW